MLFFGIVWSLICLVFDGVSLHHLLKQRAADSHAVAAGEIVSSAVRRHPDEDGESYTAEFVYTYEVGGKKYQGHLERYGAVQHFRQDSRAAGGAFIRMRMIIMAASLAHRLAYQHTQKPGSTGPVPFKAKHLYLPSPCRQMAVLL